MVIGGKWIFIHVPKNGGSSMTRALGQMHRPSPGHVPARCMAHRGLPMFGFIRNPWARMASLYEFIANKPNDHKDRIDHRWMRKAGFKRWLLEGAQFLGSDAVDGRWYDRVCGKYVQLAEKTFEGQEHYNRGGLPPLQQRPSMWWLDGCRYIGRFEEMQADLSEILAALGSKPVQVPHINRTNNKTKDWRSLYDTETIDFVAYWHKRDIDYAGYTFEDSSVPGWSGVLAE